MLERADSTSCGVTVDQVVKTVLYSHEYLVSIVPCLLGLASTHLTSTHSGRHMTSTDTAALLIGRVVQKDISRRQMSVVGSPFLYSPGCGWCGQ